MANANSRSWHMSLPCAIVAWAIIIIVTAIAGVRLGFGGGRFAVALAVAALLFAFEFWLAAPSALERARAWLGGHGRALASIVPLVAVIIYSLGVTGSGKWLLAGAL